MTTDDGAPAETRETLAWLEELRVAVRKTYNLAPDAGARIAVLDYFARQTGITKSQWLMFIRSSRPLTTDDLK